MHEFTKLDNALIGGRSLDPAEMGHLVSTGLECRDQTFGDLFKADAAVRIPPYQRNYRWKAENIQKLWQDCTDAIHESAGRRTLFLGSLVFYRERLEDGTLQWELVDGQQRLTTISLLLLALRKDLLNLPENQGVLSIADFNRILFQVDSRNRNELRPDRPLRLTLSTRDHDNFQAYAKGLPPRDRRTMLNKAWDLVQRIVASELEDMVRRHVAQQPGLDWTDSQRAEVRASLLVQLSSDVFDLLQNTATFSVVRVSAPYNPLVVFENLNSTGMELAASDLIKNWLLQRIPERELPTYQRRWDSIVDGLPKNDITGFIRSWYIARHDHVTGQELYERIKETVRTRASVDELLVEWEALMPWYNFIVQGGRIPQGGSEPETSVNRFRALNFKQARPILLSFVSGNAVRLLPQAVGLLSILFIRVIKSQQVRGSVVEAEVSGICQAGRRNGEDGLNELRNVVRRLCLRYAPSLNWSEFVVDDYDLQRFLLNEISNHLVGSPWSPPAATSIEVEHVLPQRRKQGTYPAFTDEEHEQYVENVGNLTLILDVDNGRCSNKKFLDKKAVYAEYDGAARRGHSFGKNIPITFGLSSIEDWTPATLRARANELAAVAERVWPIPA